MKGKLSERQQFILEFIREFMDEHQFPPTVRDIQGGCDISSTSVVDYNLHILQREGHLRRLPEVSRGIELLDGFRSSRRDIVSVPIVGNIAAGEPLHIPAAGSREDDEFENVDLPSFLTGGKANVYGLRVKGTSMIDAFIADGDLVLLEPITQPQSGDMVAAEYLVGLDEIPGLREAAAQLAGGDSPARMASAIEFILEGLHLSNRLNKTETEAGARYHP